MMGFNKSYTKIFVIINLRMTSSEGIKINTTFIILVTFFNSQRFCKLFKQPFFECWPSSKWGANSPGPWERKGGQTQKQFSVAVWASDWPINNAKAQVPPPPAPPPHAPGGYSKKFYTGRLCPEVQPLTLSCTIFQENGTPFIYLLLTNGAPFTYLVRTLHPF